ncbi:hypothetical protein CMO92_00910 [Candidatus Woesearchaeota archaeon]|nr:hypothetical protein [Candidatus Woesearchaeota archaeon]
MICFEPQSTGPKPAALTGVLATMPLTYPGYATGPLSLNIHKTFQLYACCILHISVSTLYLLTFLISHWPTTAATDIRTLTHSYSMKIQHLQAKSILNPSRLPGITYAINPYTGCQHACIYCYADFMKRYTGHLEAWGNFVDIKVNAVELLEQELQNKPKGLILLSSVTDPYQPLELKEGKTRSILKFLLKHQYPVSILTKSDLVLRDLDLIEAFDDIEIGISITTLNETHRKTFEPCTITTQRRIEALKELKQKTIPSYTFIGPILPGTTNLNKILHEVAPFSDFIYCETLNFRGKTEQLLQHVQTHTPELLNAFLFAVKHPHEHTQQLQDQVNLLQHHYGKEIKLFTHLPTRLRKEPLQNHKA